MTDAPSGRFAAFAHPAFRRFFIAGTLTNTARWVNFIVIPKVIYDLTGSATWIGIVSFATLISLVVVNPFAGSLSDRVERLVIVKVTAIVQMALAAVTLGVFAAGVREPVVYVVLTFVIGIAFGIQLPNWQAFVSDVVPRADLVNAVTMNSAQFNAARAVGPALGGLVVAEAGSTVALGLYVALNVASVATLVGLHLPPVERAPRPSTSFREDYRETLRYAFSIPGIRIALIVTAFVGGLGTPISQQVIVFAEEVFEVSAGLFGLLISAQGIGAVCAAPFVAGESTRISRARLEAVAVALFGGSIFLLAVAPVYAVGLVALFLQGAARLTSSSTLNSSVQLQVVEEMRGRVMALYLLCVIGVAPFTALVFGILIETLGPRVVVGAVGVVMLALLAVTVASGRLGALDDDVEEMSTEKLQP